MEFPETDPLAPLVVKWLLHDFASPIATMLTASELLGDRADRELNSIVTGSARRLAARLRLVRAALAPGDGPVGGAALVKLLAEGVVNTPVEWAVPASDIGGGMAALIAATVLLLADVRRGTSLVIGATGIAWPSPYALPPGITAALAGEAATDPRAALAAMVLASAGRAGQVLLVGDTGIDWHPR
jgi:hypothetical protein